MQKEIFRTGFWRDSAGNTANWTLDKLKSIVQKFNSSTKLNSQGKRVPLVAGHPKTDSPAFGWVSELRIEGDRLVSAFEDVVDNAKEWAKKKIFREVSIALNPDGSLRHVGMLGGAPPAIPGLEEWKFEDEGEFTEYVFNQNKEPNMELADALAKITVLEGQNEKLTKEFEEAKTKVTELETKVSESEAKVTETEKKFSDKEKEFNQLIADNEAKDEERADKADLEFTEGLIKEKKLRPADKEITLMNLKAHRKSKPMEFTDSDGKKIEKTPLEQYKETLSASQEVIETGRQFTEGVPAGNAKEVKLDKLTTEYADKNGLSYNEAGIAVLQMHPELAEV
jgi:hypothetical protein